MLRKKQLDAQRRDPRLEQVREAMQGKNFCKGLKDDGDLWEMFTVTVEPLLRGEDPREEDVLTPGEVAQRLKPLSPLGPFNDVRK